MIKTRPLLLLFLLLTVSLGVTAQGLGRETSVTLHSTITGNQEQPRVMYIVPWDQPGGSGIEPTFQRNITRELFAPIDREEYRRRMTYRQTINTEKQGEDHGKL